MVFAPDAADGDAVVPLAFGVPIPAPPLPPPAAPPVPPAPAPWAYAAPDKLITSTESTIPFVVARMTVSLVRQAAGRNLARRIGALFNRQSARQVAQNWHRQIRCVKPW